MSGIKAPPDYARRVLKKALIFHIIVNSASWIGFLLYLKVMR